MLAIAKEGWWQKQRIVEGLAGRTGVNFGQIGKYEYGNWESKDIRRRRKGGVQVVKQKVARPVK